MPTATHPLDLVALKFSGDQSKLFLQGMMTNDIHALTASIALPTLFCQYQGKLLASGYLIAQSDDEIWLLCSSEQARSAMNFLTRYALLSRVTLSIQNLDAKGAITEDAHPAPIHTLRSDMQGTTMLIGPHCLLHWSVQASDTSLTETLPSTAWQSALIRANIPLLSEALLDRFTPNQLGLVPSNWVSLNKGCYCGQEIIARSFHLGKTQRQLLGLICLQPCSQQLQIGSTLTTDSGSKLRLLAMIEIGTTTLLQVSGCPESLNDQSLSITTPEIQPIACKQIGA